jgi:hypothetical protein
MTLVFVDRATDVTVHTAGVSSSTQYVFLQKTWVTLSDLFWSFEQDETADRGAATVTDRLVPSHRGFHADFVYNIDWFTSREAAHKKNTVS